MLLGRGRNFFPCFFKPSLLREGYLFIYTEFSFQFIDVTLILPAVLVSHVLLPASHAANRKSGVCATGSAP